MVREARRLRLESRSEAGGPTLSDGGDCIGKTKRGFGSGAIVLCRADVLESIWVGSFPNDQAGPGKVTWAIAIQKTTHGLQMCFCRIENLVSPDHCCGPIELRVLIWTISPIGRNREHVSEGCRGREGICSMTVGK